MLRFFDMKNRPTRKIVFVSPLETSHLSTSHLEDSTKLEQMKHSTKTLLIRQRK